MRSFVSLRRTADLRLSSSIRARLAFEIFDAEAKSKNLDIIPSRGEDLEPLAEDVVTQPPEMVERLKKLLSQ